MIRIMMMTMMIIIIITITVVMKNVYFKGIVSVANDCFLNADNVQICTTLNPVRLVVR